MVKKEKEKKKIDQAAVAKTKVGSKHKYGMRQKTTTTNYIVHKFDNPAHMLCLIVKAFFRGCQSVSD